MENNNINNQNGAAPASKGAIVPKGEPNGENEEVKEGNAHQQRPANGADGGPNTSTRDDQLPSLNDGQSNGSDTAGDDGEDEQESQETGSDADQDRGGEPSL